MVWVYVPRNNVVRPASWCEGRPSRGTTPPVPFRWASSARRWQTGGSLVKRPGPTCCKKKGFTYNTTVVNNKTANQMKLTEGSIVLSIRVQKIVTISIKSRPWLDMLQEITFGRKLIDLKVGLLTDSDVIICRFPLVQQKHTIASSIEDTLN